MLFFSKNGRGGAVNTGKHMWIGKLNFKFNKMSEKSWIFRKRHSYV